MLNFCPIGGAPANGADGGELQKLQEELESKDKQVEERDQLIEKLVSVFVIAAFEIIKKIFKYLT